MPGSECGGKGANNGEEINSNLITYGSILGGAIQEIKP